MKHIGQVVDWSRINVAPHAGAWIETDFFEVIFCSLAESRPTRARGLKRYAKAFKARAVSVAPHAGAWIETLRSH